MIRSLLSTGAFALSLTGASTAQTLNCADPQTQIEMTGCAAKAFETADTMLNASYGEAVLKAHAMDAATPGLTPPNFDMLRDAQRAWIPFRDAACAGESTVARGGSMQNLLFYICLERLTRQRTYDLDLFAKDY